MKIDFNLLRSFRKNLKSLKLVKKELERELMHLRVEIQEHEMAIDYVERNIKKETDANRKPNRIKTRD